MAFHLVVNATNRPEDFTYKLRQAATRALPNRPAPPSPAFGRECGCIIDVAVGPEKVVFLFESGDVCRTKVSIDPSHLPIPESANKAPPAPSDWSLPNNDGQSIPQRFQEFLGGDMDPRLEEQLLSMGRQRLEELEDPAAPLPNEGRLDFGVFASRGGLSLHGAPPSRGRGSLHPRGSMPSRGGGRPFGFGMGARRSVPASAVPDDLVQRVLEILPNKSRPVIVRQLQRTGLDVDAAVNHLLMSEDDDAGNEGEDMYAPNPEEEEPNYYAQLSAPPSFGQPVQAFPPSDIMPSSLGGPPHGRKLARPAKKAEDPSANSNPAPVYAPPSSLLAEAGTPAYSFGEVEWWAPESLSDRPVAMRMIRAMHSGVVLVDEHGVLHLWRWDHAPTQGGVHPKNATLKLTRDDPIVALSCSMVRGTVQTRSGKLASFLDPCVTLPEKWGASSAHPSSSSSDPSSSSSTGSPILNSLEHELTEFASFAHDPVLSLSVNERATFALTKSGRVFSWGFAPLHLVEANLKKVQQKRKGKAEMGMLHVGYLVALKNSPLLRPGAIAMRYINNIPKFGRLMDTVWGFADTPQFELLDGSVITWPMTEVMILHEGITRNVGLVLKVDETHAAVFFSDNQAGLELIKAKRTPPFDLSMWENIRLYKTEELTVVDDVPSSGSGSSNPSASPFSALKVSSSIPKKVSLGDHQIKCMAVSSRVLHVVFEQGEHVKYSKFDLGKGLLGELSLLPLSSESLPRSRLVASPDDSHLLLFDATGSVVQLNHSPSTSCLFLPRCTMVPTSGALLSFEHKSSSHKVVAFPLVVQQHVLLPHIFDLDMEAFQACILSLEESVAKRASCETVDGNRNIFHLFSVLLAKSFVASNSPLTTPTNVVLKEILDILSTSSMRPHLLAMLAMQDARGLTPFMSLVTVGAYGLALHMAQLVVKLAADSENPEETIRNVLGARDPLTGQTPLHAMFPDMCTYSRLGPQHIPQEIFECHTCKMVDGLCLCSACAKTCHVGHDCRLKRMSSSAYCDCHEKLKCFTLAPRGRNSDRKELFQFLLQNTTLSTLSNKSEHSFLTHLLGLVVAQGEDIPSSTSHAIEEESERSKLLPIVAGHWPSLRAAILTGVDLSGPVPMEGAQSSTAVLDLFTSHLLSSKNKACLSIVLSTMIKAVNQDSSQMSILARFVRSVVRAFTVFTAQQTTPASFPTASPSPSGTNWFEEQIICDVCGASGHSSLSCPSSMNNAAPRGSESSNEKDSSPLKRCRWVFSVLRPLAIQELAENADALIAPVRLGLVRPHTYLFEPDHHALDMPSKMMDEGILGGPKSSNLRFAMADQSEDEDEAGSQAGDDDSDAGSEYEVIEVGQKDRDSSKEKQSSDASSLPLDAFSWAVRMPPQPSVVNTAPKAVSGPPGVPQGRYQYVVQSNRPVQSLTHEHVFASVDMLCRLYSRLVKEMADLSANVGVSKEETLHDPNSSFLNQAVSVMEGQMERTWQWLCVALDSLEAQLRTGMHYMSAYGPSHEQELTQKRAAAEQAVQRKRYRSTKRKGDFPPSQPVPQSSSSGPSTLGFQNYVLSLMRAHSGEHGDSLPSLDVARCRHLAYTLDAFMYYLKVRRSLQPAAVAQREFFLRTESVVAGGLTDPQFHKPVHDALPLADRPDKLHPSSSRVALFGGSDGERTVSTRLAPQHLGFSSRLSLGGSLDTSMASLLNVSNVSPLNTSHVSQLSTPTNKGVPNSLALSMMNTPVHNIQSLSEFTVDAPVERWSFLISLFGKLFLSDVGSERDSFLAQLAGFKVKETKFRESMDAIKRECTFDVKLELSRERDAMLMETFSQFRKHYLSKQHAERPFACRAVKVQFKNEPGEGSGVARSYYVCLAEALLADLPLPSMPQQLPSLSRAISMSHSLSHSVVAQIHDAPEDQRRGLLLEKVFEIVASLPSCKRPSVARQVASAIVEPDKEVEVLIMTLVESDLHDLVEDKLMMLRLSESFHDNDDDDDDDDEVDEEDSSSEIDSQPSSSSSKPHPLRRGSVLASGPSDPADLAALFFAPGRPGYFSPNTGTASPYRLEWFRNVGRVIGMCLLHNDIFPLNLNRHVIKFLLGRKVAWHDLAFFDPDMYENMRKLILSAETFGAEEFEALGLFFKVDLRGGKAVELLPGGTDIPVTKENVHQYVELHAQQLMVESQRPALQALRKGLMDVLPAPSLTGLTAEDVRLLLNGCPAIDIALLRTCTSFIDETGKSQSASNPAVETVKKWFWQIVEHMGNTERQDLVYFWTSSPTLPATEAGFVPKPTVVIRPSSDERLPTANTCISRLSIPLYSSKKLLRKKLLLAIQTKNFGFV